MRLTHRNPARSITACFLLITVPWTIGQFCAAQAADPPNPLPPQPVILSASELSYPPFCFVGQDGEATGFSVELMRAALAKMGRDVTFQTGVWHEVRGLLERGEVQSLPLVGRTAERESLFEFTFPYMSLLGAVVVRDEDTSIRSFSDLRGKQVAVMKGDNMEEFLRREERRFQIRTTDTFEDALRQLSAGQHDAVVIQRLVALRLIQETGLKNLRVLNQSVPEFRQDFCFAVKFGDRETLALLNDGLGVVFADGTYQRLHSKWFAALDIPYGRSIVVGGDHNFPPLEFLDGRGHPTGFNVDLTRAIASQMGLDIQFRLGPWSEILQGLEDGDIDVVHGIFYSTERDKRFDFAPRHLEAHYVAVVRDGEERPPETWDELTGKAIVIQHGDLMHDALLELGVDARISFAETHQDALRELAGGQHDCALVLRLCALHVIREQGWQHLRIGQRPLHSADYSYAVASGQTALLTPFAEGLAELREKGEYQRIYDQWLGVYEPSPVELSTVLSYIGLIAVPLLILMMGLYTWNWTLRRQVDHHTAELRQSETTLLQSRESYRELIENLNEVVFSLRLDGTIDFISPVVREVLGDDPQELVGQPFSRDIHPDDVEELTAILEETIAQRRPAVHEFRLFDRSGGTHWVRASARVRLSDGQPDGVQGVLMDITDQKRVEADRERLFAAIEQSGEAISITDLSGTIEYVNLAFQTVTGYASSEVLGQNPRILKSGQQDEAFYRQMWETILGGNVWRGRMVNRCKDGALYTEDAIISPVRDQSGTIGHFVGVARDVTEQIQRAAQLQQTQKMESVGQLAGGIAHDFNNLLSVILGFAGLALNDVAEGTPLYDKLIEIHHAGERAADLTRQLLAFGRRQVLHPVPFDLNTVVQGMENMLRRILGEDIDLRLILAADTQCIVADPGQIEQVLMNLVVNARDAMPTGGWLTIETASVEVDNEFIAQQTEVACGSYVRLAVSDTGCGMDAAILSRVFEPFFTTKAPDQGTGLGLPTAHGIVKQSGGDIRVYSEIGKGSTFKVYFPRTLQAPVNRRQAQPERMPHGNNELVLVVEDDPSLRTLLESMLTAHGYRVTLAADGFQALETVQHQNLRPDLVLTDVIMPGMSGKQLADRLCEKHPGLKILFMSGYTDNAITHHGILDTGIPFLHKPFSRTDLITRVADLLADRRPVKAGPRNVLMIDDEPAIRSLVELACKQRGHRFVGVSHTAAALESLAARPADVLLIDMNLSGEDGESALREIRAAGHSGSAVMYSGDAGSVALDAIRPLGAVAVVEKSHDLRQLLDTIERI